MKLKMEKGYVCNSTFSVTCTRYNIQYGRIGAPDSQVEEAATAADMHSRILTFPNGTCHTAAGDLVSNAVGLSEAIRKISKISAGFIFAFLECTFLEGSFGESLAVSRLISIQLTDKERVSLTL